MTPFSPWIGSRITAATVSSRAAARASASPYSTKTTSPGSGSNGLRYFSVAVRASAPMVRPWKEPVVEITFVRPVRRVTLKAASLASVPEFVKNTWVATSAPAAARRPSRSPSSTCQGVAKKFDVCIRVAAWSASAATSAGWACPRALTAMPPSRSR